MSDDRLASVGEKCPRCPGGIVSCALVDTGDESAKVHVVCDSCGYSGMADGLAAVIFVRMMLGISVKGGTP